MELILSHLWHITLAFTLLISLGGFAGIALLPLGLFDVTLWILAELLAIFPGLQIAMTLWIPTETLLLLSIFIGGQMMAMWFVCVFWSIRTQNQEHS